MTTLELQQAINEKLRERDEVGLFHLLSDNREHINRALYCYRREQQREAFSK